MKYKVGDKVRVIVDLMSVDYESCYGVVEDMMEMQGQIVTIIYIKDDGYRIKECGFTWEDCMLEDVEPDSDTID